MSMEAEKVFVFQDESTDKGIEILIPEVKWYKNSFRINNNKEEEGAAGQQGGGKIKYDQGK